MIFNIVNISHKTPDWIKIGLHEYQKRFMHPFKLHLHDLPIHKNSLGQVEKIKELEGKQLLSVVQPKSLIIALDPHGKMWSSEEFSKNISKWQLQTSQIFFLIGGAYGLSESCLSQAHHKWSLSPLIFPHQLVKLLLAEQLYRAVTLIQNHPYHK